MCLVIMKKGCKKENKRKTEKKKEKRAGDEGREKVQYNYPGTFQSRYVKPAHCAAVDNMTA